METKSQQQPKWMPGALAGVTVGVAGFTHSTVPLDGWHKSAAVGAAAMITAVLFLLIFWRKKTP